MKFTYKIFSIIVLLMTFMGSPVYANNTINNSDAVANTDYGKYIEKTVSMLKHDYNISFDLYDNQPLLVNKIKPQISKTVQLYRFYKVGNAPIGLEFVCSGFFIDGGYVISAQHCFSNDDESNPPHYMVADGSNKYLIPAKLVQTDSIYDLALLQTDDIDHVYFNLADSVSYAERVTIIGSSPDHNNDKFVEASGTVINTGLYVRVQKSNGPLLSETYRIYTSAGSWPGYSGGPALNDDGDIIGVTVSTTNNTDSYLVRLNDLKDFINTYINNDSN